MTTKNVIILTCGQSGSSVLAGVIARAGYWHGDDTKKIGYDTHENYELVDINKELLAAADIDWGRLGTMLSRPPLERLRALVESRDQTGDRAFVAKCDTHRPWVWKDPRLSFTIAYWEALIDLEQCLFIVMDRNHRQAWSGHVIKGKPPITFEHFRGVQRTLVDASLDYVRNRGLPHMVTTFEELTAEPGRVLDELNAFLDTSLDLDDLKSVYSGPLGRLRYNRFDYLHAWAKFQAQRWILGRRVITAPKISAVT